MAEIGVASNKKLIELFNMMKEGSLILKPYFQRKLVWNDRHKESFIETILLGFPFPEIYLADGEIDLRTQKSKTLVVDGQQRLSAIYQYVTGSQAFMLSRIKRFSELTDSEKTSFFDYFVVVRELGRIDDSKIIEIFKRINSVQYALNSMEIKNALYQGDFITTAREIAESASFEKQVEIFTDVEYSRMKDTEFILLIMATIEENGYFTGGKGIETYVIEYDSEYPNKKPIVSDFDTVFKLMSDCNLPVDSIWSRKTNFFTLVVELIRFKRKNGVLPITKSLSALLLKFEKELLKNKTGDINSNEFAAYYYYVFQATSSRKGRSVRGKLLTRYLDRIK